MQLFTQQIRDFQKRTGFIRQNNLLPVLQYILLKDGYLIKTNMAAWAKMPVDAPPGETLLLDENMLYNFASRTTAEYIDITVKGKQVHLAADMQSRFQWEEPTNYPVMPQDDDSVAPQPITDTAPYRMAAAYALKGESIPTFKGFVHSVNNLIWAGDGSGFFSYKQIGPTLTLSMDAVQAITQFESIEWRKAGNYDFFHTPAITYGFIGTEIKGPDITMHLADRSPSAATTINRQWLINYCEMCVTSTPKSWAEVVLTTGLGQLCLDMADDDYNTGNSISMPCEVEIPEFHFNAALMLTMLKALPYENLIIYRDHVQLTIRSEDENFQAMLQGLIPNDLKQ